MKTTIRTTLILCTCLHLLQPAYGQSVFPEPNWDRALAVESAQTIDTDEILKSLFQPARAGASRQVLDALSAVEQNDNWSVPAREYIIWSFTIDLADLDVNTVSREVLDYLSVYESRVLVAHDDRDSVGVPLFNISAAATGVRNSWARQQGSRRAVVLLQNDPAWWINAYLKAGTAGRRGFTDALDFASKQQLDNLARSAIERLTDHPGLTAIAGKSALILGDRNLLQQTLARGSGPDLHHVLKAASKSLNAEENKFLLFQAIRQGPDRMAGLAIALLAPALLKDMAVRDKMFEMLENRDLGSSAALVLGSSTNPEIRNRMKTIAAGKEGLASQRASLAIGAAYQESGSVR